MFLPNDRAAQAADLVAEHARAHFEMEKILQSQPLAKLLRRVAVHIRRHDMTVTQFGLAAANNTTLIARLQQGNVTARTIAKVESFLAKARKRRKARRLGGQALGRGDGRAIRQRRRPTTAR